MFTARAVSTFPDAPADFPAIYKHQFQISACEATCPPGWIRTDMDGVHIDVAPDLPITRLQCANGGVVALVLGLAVDADGRLLADVRDLSDTDGNCSTATLEAFIESLAGRYVAVVSCGGDKRLYLDPVGDLSAVYNAGAKVAASTSLFAIDRGFIDNPLLPYSKVKTGELSYSLGHTRDAEVRRQFANHYLDLTTFQQVRHWPKEDTDLTTRDSEAEISDIMDRITARLSSVFCEILREKTCIVPLSGGRDSRCLVACGLPEIHRANTLFAWRFHRMSKWDSEIGSEIAESLGLPYEVFNAVRTTRADKMLYLRRNGFNLFSDALRSLATCEALPGGMVMTRGNVMGVLRATNWRAQREGELKPGHALRRLLMGDIREQPGLVAQLKAELKTWHQSLPECGKLKVYDMLWFDMVLTHGQGTRNYGTPNNFVVNPFNDRLCLQLSMQLPLDLRRTDKAYDMIIDRTAPQLKEFRYN